MPATTNEIGRRGAGLRAPPVRRDIEDTGADRRANAEHGELEGPDTSFQMIRGTVCDGCADDGSAPQHLFGENTRAVVRWWVLLVRPFTLGLFQACRASARAAASCSTAQSISSAVITRGGAKRRVDPVGVLHQHPALGERKAELLAGTEGRVDVDAGPQSKAADSEYAVADQAAGSPECKRPPSSVQRDWNSPASSIDTTVVPIAVASGLPPNVEPCSPGCRTSRMWRSVHHGRHCGTTPPPSALPSR